MNDLGIDAQFLPGGRARQEEYEQRQVHGIPANSHHEEGVTAEPAVEEVGVFADMEQDRFGLTGELYNPIKGIEQLNFSSAYTDYQHAEIEDGIPGTSFTNKTFEARLTAEHEDIANWRRFSWLASSN
ncbi:MAG: hypothetical protein U5L01_01120 [Rheinheimera sp.]|nr:hypothetical protein [Rheinheimera sp.]